ncbi:MAG: D-alanyl-D-alanine carboxypeptidase/D-alanyl-D-alanine-endopeptidase [Gammaproteobacteria bacterium]|nr:D-alanyl-D-alanine carboxypeptidase/D-alanyl-D-alanine-endopeptidase [Gammaproteobacteria bacterium]
MSKTLLLCAALVLHTGLAAAAKLPGDLRALLDRYPVPGENLGLYIAPVGGGDAISVNGRKPFNPASVIKLLPSLAALEMLTPAYRWETRVHTSGPTHGGVLNGDLHIQGGGDPYLTVEYLWALLRNVRAQGIERITGDIVVDDGVFRIPAFDRAAFDDKPHMLYNGPANGLLMNFWSVQFTIRAHSDRVSIDAFPDSDRLRIVSNIKHSNAGCDRSQRWIRYTVEQASDSVAITFNGVLSSRCRPIVITRAVIPVERYAEFVLPGLWRSAGGALDGEVRRGGVPEDTAVLLTHPSRSLAAAVLAANKFSNNMIARHLLLTLGTVAGERGVGPEDGVAALNDWIVSKGLDVPGLKVINGSGLSRDTRISAQGVANVLQAGFRSRYAPEFLASLPIAGEDRALARRGFEEPDGAVVRVKTGLLDHVRAMGGYITTRRGETYVVVLLINHEGIHQGLGTRMQNALIRHVLDF